MQATIRVSPVVASSLVSQDAGHLAIRIQLPANAGGKKAVLWGTAVDNLVSWRMVTPDAQWLEVTRLDHNLGKIHDAAFATFELKWLDRDGRSVLRTETLRLPGASFRKATRFNAPRGSPAARARAAAVISESIGIPPHLSLPSFETRR